jgi:hypothetical protein
MSKIDYNRGKNQISGRYFYTNYSTPTNFAASRQNLLNAFNSAQAVRIQTLSLDDTYSASPTLLFNTWFGWDIQHGGTISDTDQNYKDFGVGVAAAAIPPQIQGITVSGFFSVASGTLGQFNRGSWRIRELVTKIAGRHQLRFGGEAIRILFFFTNSNNTNGVFTFGGNISDSNLADFMLGQASSFTQSALQQKDQYGTLYSLFVQDDWRATSNLTVNFGMRWDPFWPFRAQEPRFLFSARTALRAISECSDGSDIRR